MGRQDELVGNLAMQSVRVAFDEARLQLLALRAHLELDVVEMRGAVIVPVGLDLRHAPIPVGLAEIQRSGRSGTLVPARLIL